MARTRSKAKVVPAEVAAVPADLLGVVTHGECVNLMWRLPAGSVDTVFCDPPFNIAYDYASHDDNMKPEDYLRWCVTWLNQAVRVLKPTGSLWIAISEEFVSELKILAEGWMQLAYPTGPGISTISRPGARLYQRHHISWYYTFGQHCVKKLTRSHTHLLHLVKSVEHHAWYPESVRVPSARQLVYNDKRANPEGRLPDDTWILRPQDLPDGFQDAGHDVWHDSRVCGTYKEKQPTPNQMPEQLLARIIRLSTAPGDLVLDPFAGSGTVPAVAKKLGRKFVAFENDPGYAASASARVAAAVEGTMLDPVPVRKGKA
jgi:predicted RNA methylase